MDRDFRLAWFEKLHPKVREYTCLNDLTREYTVEEIAVITRSGPARALGLKNKGHLGAGADADIAVYSLSDDKQEMFSSVKYLIKDGNIVFRDGSIKESFSGKALGLDIHEEAELAPDLKEYFEQYSTVALSNYRVEEEYTPRVELTRCGQ
jgi:formylmethanofuran dehydrogenase subunit A